MELQGTGFDDDPAGNRVDFARTSALPVARTAAGLLLRVPPDAGSGPVTVTTSQGSSEPLSGLEYLGLGQLRAGQVVQAVALRHRPTALFALGPDPVLDSSLYGQDGSLVGTGASPWAAAHYFQRPAASGDAFFFAEEALRLVRWVPGLGEAAAAPLEASPELLGHVGDPVRPLVVALAAGAAGDLLSTYDAATLAPVLAGAPIGLKAQSPPVDLGDGRFAVVIDDGAGALNVALVDPRGAAPLVTILPAPPAALQRFPVVLAAGLAGAERVVAVAVEGGQVGLAAVAPAPAWRAAPAGTRSPTPVTSLAVVGGRVLAAKPDDGLVLGLDAPAAAVDWALPLARPTVLAGAPDGVAWAAGDGDNAVVAIDPARGLLLGRRVADPEATSASLLAGAAWRPAGDDPVTSLPRPGAFAFPVARPPALVLWPAAGDPVALAQPLAPALVAWDPWSETLWTADAAAVSPGGAGTIAIPGGVQWLGATPGGLVTLGGALGVVRAGAAAPLADDLDTALATPARASDGRLLVVGSMGADERARLWSAAAVEAGGPPDVEATLPGFALQGAFVDGEAWVTWFDFAELKPRSARLGADGVLSGEVAGLIPEGLVSPNGRTIVVPEQGFAGAGFTALRVVALEPGSGFPTVDRIELPAAVVGMAFDASGERLYVVTRGPDQVLVLE